MMGRSLMRLKMTVVSGFLLVGVIARADAQTISPACQPHYQNYRVASGPKAFAVSRNGACGMGKGATLAAAQQNAMAFCRKYRGVGCRVAESAF